MPKSFYIIDGHAQIFRAYYAPFRELSSPAGEPTKATFVFTQWLLNLIANRNPDYLAMVIDTGSANLERTRLYPQYKANRAAAPEDLAPQEQRIIRIVRDAGIPVFAHTGFEADDLIATIAALLPPSDYELFIVSKDKDLRQLLSHTVKMYDMQTGDIIDLDKMRELCGYAPNQAVEVQTLTGDSTDNVPGIPGVGEKTAAKLIAKYGDADQVLKHLDELTPKLRENFQKYAHILPLTRNLVTLRSDVQIDNFNIDRCAFRGLNASAIRHHLQELGFTTLIKRLDALSPTPPNHQNPSTKPPPKLPFADSLFGPNPPSTNSQIPASPPTTSDNCDYRLVNTPAALALFLQQLKLQNAFAFDTETDALGPMNSNLIGMSFSWQPTTGYYIPIRGPAGSVLLDPHQTLAALKPFLENPNLKKIGHNIKYDLLVMRNAGIDLRGIDFDTMIAAFLLDSTRILYGIDRLALELLHFRKIPTSDLIGKGKDQIRMDQCPLEQVTRYASEDADIAFRLAQLLRPQLAQNPSLQKLNDDIEVPLIPVLAEMEFNGIAINPDALKEQSKVLSQRADLLRNEILHAAGSDFNPDSPKQLADVLFNRLGLRVIKRNKTGPSTDVEVLEKLASEHKVPRLILEYRSLGKLINTYLDSLNDFVNPKTGRIHASFNQTGAATGRLSCSDPNLQNIPIRTDEGARIRSAFVPADPQHNLLLTADYSQIELRILAHYTLEPALLRAFENDEDVHAAVAAEVFNVPPDKVTKQQRAQAKIVNFGIIYGISAQGLARRIEGISLPAAQALITAYNLRFPSIHKFMLECVQTAETLGYVQTILGRRRLIPELKSPVLSQRNAGQRIAINSVIQGSAADLIKLAMLNIHRRLKTESRPSKLLLQVHDELVFETPQSALESDSDMVRHEMCHAMTLKVPLKVDIASGHNWREGK